jgi:two-component system, OmpR family, heavy metal sensor histidine kinase CusS
VRHRSIRLRLTIWYTAVLSIGMILFSITLWLALRHLLYADLSATLMDQARGLEQYLHIEDGDRPLSLPAASARANQRLAHEIDEYSQSLRQRHLLTVSGPADRIIFSSPVGTTAKLSAMRSGAPEDKPRKMEWEGVPYLAVSRPVTLRQGQVQTFLAISSESVDRAVELLGLLSVIAVPAFIVCGAGGGYLFSRNALAPVDKITARARLIGLSNLSERLEVPNTNDELQRLTETWNDMLERLEGAVSKVSQFTADASHELRTPLSIIRFAAENGLRRLRSESDYRAALERIRNESENMTRLIEDLLFLARADVEHAAAELEPVELNALIEATCLDLHPLASAKEITLTRHLDEMPVMVLGNFAALRRMLLILLDNGIKYTPQGGRVSVRLERVDGHAVVRVEDTGIGIPDDAKSRVFQRFFRVDPSRSKDSGGHGLGLAIAHTIVHQHKASIELQSKPDGGCIFSISLPVAA